MHQGKIIKAKNSLDMVVQELATVNKKETISKMLVSHVSPGEESKNVHP